MIAFCDLHENAWVSRFLRLGLRVNSIELSLDGLESSVNYLELSPNRLELSLNYLELECRCLHCQKLQIELHHNLLELSRYSLVTS